jgi:hypothetical protein
MDNHELLKFAGLAFSQTNGFVIGNGWNPLESDAEAFELKDKLGVDVRTFKNGMESHQYASAHYFIEDGYSGWVHEEVENSDTDIDVRPAVRRVIVRAAAEIGKRIKK